jgi:hypothetical protein
LRQPIGGDCHTGATTRRMGSIKDFRDRGSRSAQSIASVCSVCKRQLERIDHLKIRLPSRVSGRSAISVVLKFAASAGNRQEKDQGIVH